MASGGPRNRSGPRPSETSATSDRRGFKLTALPAEGYRGEAPAFPLPEESWRELEVWAQAWQMPQACAWSLLSESWRVPTVAMWVRVRVRCEALDASPTLLAQMHRLADQIGMTTAGLSEMGWKVAPDELAVRAASREAEAPAAPAEKRQRRLRVAADGGA